ncbi:hypothetical protein FPQ18DRAFT_307698 [Pyronema domesticum]|nr:hypothetical protein FPQ18DRAFT_307698 [Pyronema domesticum]
MDSLVICCLESLIIALATLPIAPFPGSSRDPWAMSMCIGAHFTKAFVTLDSMPTGTDEAKDKNNERTARTENRIEVIFLKLCHNYIPHTGSVILFLAMNYSWYPSTRLQHILGYDGLKIRLSIGRGPCSFVGT